MKSKPFISRVLFTLVTVFALSAAMVSAQVNNIAVVASAASFGNKVGRNSIAVVFVNSQVQKVPLGTKVTIKDSDGKQHDCPIFFAGTTQVNFHIPELAAIGPATIEVRDGAGNLSQGSFEIWPVAPGIFAANANGLGPAAAVVLRVKSNGQQNYEPVARFDQVQGKFVHEPIDLGPDSDQVFLVLFGTGIRYRLSLSGVTIMIGGVLTNALYAGPQNTNIGLDQINVRLPRALAGRGVVRVIVNINGTESQNYVDIAVK